MIRRVAGIGLALALAAGLTAPAGTPAGAAPQGPPTAAADTAPATVVAPDLQDPTGVAVSGTGVVTVVDAGIKRLVQRSGAQVSVPPSASFVNPRAVAVDGNGNRYVADDNKVLKVTPAGVTTTLGFTGVSSAHGVAVDGAGKVYLSDQGNKRVVAITPGGTLSTVGAGIGTSIGGPEDLAVAPGGTVFVLEPNGNQVYRIPAGGSPQVVTLTGVGARRALTVDGAGNLYVANLISPTDRRTEIIKVTPGGVQSTIPALGVPPVNTMSIDADGNLYLTDPTTKGIAKVTPDGAVSWLPMGRVVLSPPLDVDVDAAGTVYFTSRPTAKGYVYALSATAGLRVLPIPGLLYPDDIAVTSDGTVYVNDEGATVSNGDDTFWRLTSAGVLSTIVLAASNPQGIDVSDDHTLYVADRSTDQIITRTAAGVVGTVPFTGLTDPHHVTLGPAGSVYVAQGEGFNYSVTKRTSGGTQTTIAVSGSGFAQPFGVDADGNFLVGRNGTVRRYASDGSYVELDMQPLQVVNGSVFDVTVAADGTVLAGDRAGQRIVAKSDDDPAYAVGATSVATGARLAVGSIGQLLVSDKELHRIVEIPGGGTSAPIGFPGMRGPEHVTAGADGHVYVQTSTNGIYDRAPDGTAVALGFTATRKGPLAVDAAGTVYVASSGLHKLPEGGVETPVTIPGLGGILSVAIGSDDSLYAGNAGKVVRVKNGTVTDLGISGGTLGLIAVDPAGNVFVVDRTNKRVIQRFVGGGQATLPFVGVTNPSGLAADDDGNVFLADVFGVQSVKSVVAAWAPFASWNACVTRLHQDIVGRAPTASELSSWSSQLGGGTKHMGQLADALRRGAENTENVDPTARAYRALLGRAPDAAGLKFWVGRLRSGTWTLVRMADYFANSNEFKTKYGTLTNRQFVTRIYTDVMGRPADAGGVTFWTGQIDSGKRTRGGVIIGFSESSEYKRRQLENTDVAVAYILLLNRAPTTGETTTWVTAQKAGTTHAALLLTLLKSPAYATHLNG